MEYISLSYASLGIAVLFIVSAMAVSSRYRLGLERDLAVVAIRAFLQLTAIGYVLLLLFISEKWYYVAIMLVIMLAAAVKNAVARQSVKLRVCLLRSAYPFSWISPYDRCCDRCHTSC